MSKGGSMSGRGTYDQGPMPQNPYSSGNQPRPSPSQAGAKMGGSPSMMGRGRGGQAPPNSLMAQLAANPNMPAPNQNIDIDNSSRQANVDFMNKMAQENALEGGMSPAYSYDPQTGQYARDSSSFGFTGDAATTYYSPQEFQSQFGRALGKMPSNQTAQMPNDQTRAQAALEQYQSGQPSGSVIQGLGMRGGFMPPQQIQSTMQSSGMPSTPSSTPSQYMVGLRNFDPSRSIPNIAPEPKSQTVDMSQPDPSQFRMSGGKGGYLPSGPYRPPEAPMPTVPPETMPSAPIEDTQADDPMIDPETGMDLRSDEFAQYIADKRNAEVAARNQPQPEPPPPAPFVRPRPTRGLFQNQSGIASLRGQYQPQRQTQYQPMRNLNAPRYPAPPRRPPPSSQNPLDRLYPDAVPYGRGRYSPPPQPRSQRPPPRSQPRNRYPQPPSRMPSPYPQPPRGGPSKGGFPPPQRRPSGPTKGGRPDPRYATLTGRPQPTIPFNPKFYGR